MVLLLPSPLLCMEPALDQLHFYFHPSPALSGTSSGPPPFPQALALLPLCLARVSSPAPSAASPHNHDQIIPSNLLPVHLFVCFVCKQDYTKTTKWISTKVGGRMWYGSKNQFNFGVNLDQIADPVFFISFYLIFPLFFLGIIHELKLGWTDAFVGCICGSVKSLHCDTVDLQLWPWKDAAPEMRHGLNLDWNIINVVYCCTSCSHVTKA